MGRKGKGRNKPPHAAHENRYEQQKGRLHVKGKKRRKQKIKPP